MINLHTKFADKLPPIFAMKSLTAGRTNDDFTWKGIEAIVATAMIPQALADYNRTAGANRFGTPTNVQNWKQTMLVRKDRAASPTIDNGDFKQGGMLMRAGVVVQMETTDVVNPEIETYAMEQWAQNAGIVVDAGATLSSANIAEKLLDLEVAMDDAGIPDNDRYLYIKSGYRKALRLSDEWDGSDGLKRQFVKNGSFGTFSKFNLVVAAATRFPSNVAAIATYKKSVFLPRQIATARIQENPQGIDGNVVELRYVYDAYVYGPIANGVVVLVENTKKTATPTVTKGSTTTALASTTNNGTVNIYYTDDGTDPRYSDTKKTYSAAIDNPTAGTVLKVVAHNFAAGFFGSDVKTHTCV